MTARCAHADCGRFVKTGETWCAKHAESLPTLAQLVAEDGPYANDPAAHIAASMDYIERTYGCPADAVSAALYDAEAAGHCGAASLTAVREAAGWPERPPLSDAERDAHLDGTLAELRARNEPLPVYPDAANELARGKHRPARVRWYHRLGRKGNDGLTRGERKVMASNYRQGLQRKDSR